MNCQNCGKEIPEGACVCINCGVKAPTPAQVKAANKVPGQGLGIASMILGIAGIVCCMLNVPFAIAGLITGIIANNQAKVAGQKNGMALAGIICSIITLALVVIGTIIYIILCAVGLASGLGTTPYLY